MRLHLSVSSQPCTVPNDWLYPFCAGKVEVRGNEVSTSCVHNNLNAIEYIVNKVVI